jgi:lantibiotic modifying enzyme
LELASKTYFPAAHHEEISIAHGLAGYLLSLIKLHKLRPQKTVALAIGQITNTLYGELRPNTEQPDKGYMTGSAGVLFALCKSHSCLLDSVSQPEIVQLYERLRIQWAEHMEDVRWEKESPDVLSLQNGLAGWCLTQHAMMQTHGRSHQTNFRHDIKHLLKMRSIDADHIARGLAGRIEPALQMRDVFDAEIQKFTRDWSDRYARLQRHVLAPRYLNPFFYEGTAGILYQQLRMSGREDLPSIIAFE